MTLKTCVWRLSCSVATRRRGKFDRRSDGLSDSEVCNRCLQSVMMSSLRAAANVEGIPRRLGAPKEIFVKALKFVFRQLLDASNAVFGPLHRDDQLVQL